MHGISYCAVIAEIEHNCFKTLMIDILPFVRASNVLRNFQEFYIYIRTHKRQPVYCSFGWTVRCPSLVFGRNYDVTALLQPLFAKTPFCVRSPNVSNHIRLDGWLYWLEMIRGYNYETTSSTRYFITYSEPWGGVLFLSSLNFWLKST